MPHLRPRFNSHRTPVQAATKCDGGCLLAERPPRPRSSRGGPHHHHHPPAWWSGRRCRAAVRGRRLAGWLAWLASFSAHTGVHDHHGRRWRRWRALHLISSSPANDTTSTTSLHAQPPSCTGQPYCILASQHPGPTMLPVLGWTRPGLPQHLVVTTESPKALLAATHARNKHRPTTMSRMATKSIDSR